MIQPLGWLVCWLVSLFIQGKPLASGYYSRHPEPPLGQQLTVLAIADTPAKGGLTYLLGHFHGPHFHRT